MSRVDVLRNKLLQCTPPTMDVDCFEGMGSDRTPNTPADRRWRAAFQQLDRAITRQMYKEAGLLTRSRCQ